jgi:hypothetical protein
MIVVLAAGVVLALAPGSADAAIAELQAGTELVSSTGNVTPTFAAASTAGSLLVATVTNSCTTASDAFSAPAGWVLATGTWLSGDGRVEVWYYPNNPGGISSAAFTSSSCAGSAGQLSEWSGAALSGVLNRTGTATASAATSVTVSSSASTAVSGELGITLFKASATQSSYTAASGWAHLYTDTTNKRASDDDLSLAVGTASEKETGTASGKWVAVLATFEPPAVPGSVSGLTATAGTNSATVSWTAPTLGGAVASYVVTALAGGTRAQNTTAIPSSSTSTTLTGLAAGTAYKFSVYAANVTGSGASVTTASSITPTGVSGPYAAAVLADAPTFYWRLDETAGSTALDSSGNGATATEVGAPTQGAASTLASDSDLATGFNGATQYAYSNASYSDPGTFTIEAWFKTTTTAGGKIVGFGNSQTASSSNYDRHLYMANNGEIFFGVYPGAVETINSTAAYNDGNPHYVVATLSSAGMFLYIDGALAASNPTVTSAQNYTGYWRIGDDNLAGWPSPPTSDYFNGTIDEVAVYPTALSLQQVETHYCAGGNGNCLSMTAPTLIAFPALILNGSNQTAMVTASLDVTDASAGNGWNISATSTTFTTGTFQLPTDAMTVASTPAWACDTGFTCAAPIDSVTYPYTLPAGATAPAATELVNAAAGSGTGHETITPTFSLEVPANAHSGNYTSTWTFTLASGP